MIDVDVVYQTVKNLLRKNQQGYLAPSEYNRYAGIATLSRFNELYGRTQTIQNGKQLKEAYAQTQQIDEKLSVYTISSTQAVDPTTGQFPKPDGLLRMNAVRYVFNSGIVKVKRVNQDQEADRVSSVIMPPTDEYPIYVDYGTYYQAYPFDLGNVNISYLGVPIPPLWAYTLDDNNRQIYDPDSSVNFQFESAEIGNIISKILVYAGKAVDDNGAVSLAAQLEVVGQ